MRSPSRPAPAARYSTTGVCPGSPRWAAARPRCSPARPAPARRWPRRCSPGPRPRPLPRRPRRWSTSTSARPRRTSRGLFDASERAHVVLFFDEADALFGKRTEVREPRPVREHRDRLLAAADGALRRHRRARDNRRAPRPGVLRRVRFIVQFELPTRAERGRLWQLALGAARRPAGHRHRRARHAPPRPGPRADRGGHQVGGRRRGVPRLQRGGPIAKRHVLDASRRELAKRGSLVRLASWSAGLSSPSPRLARQPSEARAPTVRHRPADPGSGGLDEDEARPHGRLVAEGLADAGPVRSARLAKLDSLRVAGPTRREGNRSGRGASGPDRADARGDLACRDRRRDEAGPGGDVVG